ncbi:PAP2 family protein [Lachnospiraceae bacterium KM106-2]|nr:PAP2 family protein [Lachnospiraceae bacterium KM106-2]
MKQYLQKYKHAWLALYFLIYLPWFFYLEQRLDIKHIVIETKLDSYIPFCEYFVIPYILWFGYVAWGILYFFFTSKNDYYKCCAFLFIGMTICLIIYTFWPNAQHLRPTHFENNNIFTKLVNMFYTADSSTNVCPSIHCYNSIGIHIAVSKSERLKNRPLIRWTSFILAVSICLSTMFIKQHSAFDVICAVILSCIVYVFVYKIDYAKIIEKIQKKKDLRLN